MEQLCLSLMLMRSGREEMLNSNPGLPSSLPCLSSGQSQLGAGRVLKYPGDQDATQLAGKGARVSLILIAPFVQESQ